MSKPVIIVLAIVAALLVGAGCGSGSGNPSTGTDATNGDGASSNNSTDNDSGENEGPSTSNDSNAPNAPTGAKAQFIERADAICRKADEEQFSKLGKVTESADFEKKSEARQEEIIAMTGLSPVQKEGEEIAALEPPPGDEAEIEAIVKGIEEAVAQAEREARTAKGVSGEPFKSVQAMARKYGFKDCADPL